MHDLQGTLYLDIEDDVLPLLHGLVGKLFRRAVDVTYSAYSKKASSEIILRNSSTSVK